MENENDPVQLRITADGKHMIAEGYMRKGMVFWTSRKNADQYINKLHIAEPVGQGLPGPTETKPMAPVEKKPSDVAKDGPSTDSLRSSAAGTEQRSSALPADQVLQKTRSPRSRPRKARDKG